MSFWTWQLPALGAALLLILPMVWQKPVRAVYVLVGAATSIEIFPLGFPDSLTDTIPFFLNLNNSASLPVSISPAEIVMAVALAAWAGAAARRESDQRPGGRLLKAYLAYLLVVVMAEGWGLTHGGDLNKSLWELRPQVYGCILFVLAASLIRERRQVVTLAVVFLATSALKAGIGYVRYFHTLHGGVTDAEAILAHEDSYFLVMFVAATVVALIWVRRRQVLLPLLAVAPLAGIVMFENKRRVGELALIAAVVVVVALGIWFEQGPRWRLVAVSALVAGCFGVFVAVHWNADYGLAGQIVRPVRTTLTGEVDQRDLLSNLYRDNENLDIKATYALSPVIGVGFGIPMDVPFPLADISQQYPLWQYMPHNSLLWVAMRMGVIGMAAFWALIAMIVLEGVAALRGTNDPLLRGVAAFALAAVVAELVVAYGDVQLENYRNMIFTGAMIGLLDAIPRMRRIEAEAPAADVAAVGQRARVRALAPSLSAAAPDGGRLARTR